MVKNMNWALIDWLLGEDLIFVMIIIALCTVLAAGLRGIKSGGGKFLLVVAVGTGITYFILRILDVL